MNTPDNVRISKTQRWLDLIAFLVKRRLPVAFEEVMEGVPAYREKWITEDEQDRAAVRRMFERDKDQLRDLGVPLQTVPYTVHYGAEQIDGYRLARQDFYLPYLRVLKEAGEGEGEAEGEGEGEAAEGGNEPGTQLHPESPTTDNRSPIPDTPAGEVELTEDDAAAAIDALSRTASLPNSPFADAARTALRKLAFDLDIDALATAPVLFAEPPVPPGGGDLRGRIQALIEAVRARKTVEFTYHGIYRDEATDRAVAPYGLLMHHGHWYLVGHDDLRDDRRVFRLGRMEKLQINRKQPKDPDYTIPDDFDLADLAGRRPWELGDDADPVTARVRFEFPTALWADRNRYGVLKQALEGGASIREFTVHQVDPFLRWVLSQAGEATVVGPPELVELYDGIVARTAALYTDPSGEEGP